MARNKNWQKDTLLHNINKTFKFGPLVSLNATGRW